ncbi:MAG: type I DNA topoisomerase [Anaerolineales bacterium]|nr:type I DNA topoisomerase [Anaerolineales bacterium]
MEGYCLKCKAKREIAHPEPAFLSNGRPTTKGLCAVCGTKIQKMGLTEAHAGLTPPAPVQRETKRPKRNGKLVIVESPTKAKTVGRFLGKGFQVRASVGHVRDLLRSQLSVDVDNGFTPKYRIPNEKRPVVKELKALAQQSEEVYLATDPDREGEAIAWHLKEAVELDDARTRRVVFHEITRSAVEEAFRHPREIDMNLVNAQQARRILDRLVGYMLSPLLWAKVRSRLSAGRVQSVALRLVVEREREINAFEAKEYWSIETDLAKQTNGGIAFRAKLMKADDQEVSLGSQADAASMAADLEKASYLAARVRRGIRKRNPSAPFTTSTLQQEASRKLGFSPKKTMAIAQQLYEGVELDSQGMTGLITYMRTDSTQVAEVAQQEAREWIAEKFGKEFLPAEPPQYRTRSRSAQEAHEAIRPTSVLRQPKALQEYLSRDQNRLYGLIWQRFLASQMAPAQFDTVQVDVEASGARKYLLRASGAMLRFQGFLAVYEEAKDEDQEAEEEAQATLPPLEEGEPLRLIGVLPEQHFTQPPPRYTEAALIRALEEFDIGRPSTYAPILSTIQQRGYAVREEKRLLPTEIGFTVNDMLVTYFPDVINTGFTATMEDELDEIAEGAHDWTATLKEFYEPFSRDVKHAEQEIPKADDKPEPAGRDCPTCGNPLVIRFGRFGKFIGCSTFPACRYVEPWLEKTGVACPKDGGDLVERKTRKGRTFYACSNYPTCDFTSWKKPLPIPCPACGGLLVLSGRQTAQCIKCEAKFPLDAISAKEAEAR